MSDTSKNQAEIEKRPDVETVEYKPGAIHEIKIRAQHNMGKMYYYPDDCRLAEEILVLMKRKAFMQDEFQQVKKLGRMLGVEFRIVAVREVQYFGEPTMEYTTKE